MNTFLLKILKYALIVIAITASLLYFSSIRYWSNRIPTIKSRINVKQPGKASIILGSSHVFYGVNTTLIGDNCYNLASTSQGLFEDFYILKYFSAKSTLDYVVVPFSYFSNHHDLSEYAVEGESLRIFDYEKAYGIKYKKTRRYYRDKMKLFGQFAANIFQRHDVKSEFDESGNLKSACKGTLNNLGDSITAFQRHDAGSDFNKRNPYLDSIVNFCYAHQIRLYVIVPPVSKGYRDQIMKHNPYFYTFLEKIRSYSEGKFVFIDCQDFFKENEPMFFMNADHLSPCGRDTFSLYLKQVIAQQPE